MNPPDVRFAADAMLQSLVKMDPASRLRLRRRRRFIRAKTPAVKNRAHARLNPFARMRDDGLTFDLACTTSDINLLIAPPLKVSDCSQITDGAAAVVLCSKHFIERVQPPGAVRLIGCAHTTDYLSLLREAS